MNCTNYSTSVCSVHGNYTRTDGYSGCPWCYPGAHTLPASAFAFPPSPTMYPHICPVCAGTMNVPECFYPDMPDETLCRACNKGVVYTV